MVKLILSMSVALSLVVLLLPHLVWLLLWLVAKCFRQSISYAPFGWTSVGLLAIVWIVLAYGFFVGRFRLQTSQLKYAHADVPAAFDGFRIVHISDFHLSTFQDNPQQLARFVDSINAQRPDLICFTGDLVSLGIDEAAPCIPHLQRLQATYGVCSVLGNHDFFIYSRQFSSQRERLQAVEALATLQREQLGWHLLRNQSYPIERGGDTLTILGVDNCNFSNQGFRTINCGDLGKAMQGTDGFRILLSHDPSHWTAEVVPQTDIPLTLSGHTHAAQIRFWGWTPANLTFRETYGLYERDGQSLYINIGLGCTVPLRLGANPEITVIQLKRK